MASIMPREPSVYVCIHGVPPQEPHSYAQPSLALPTCAESAVSLCFQDEDWEVVEPHLDGEGAHLQGADVPGMAAGGAPAPTRAQVRALNRVRNYVFLHESVPW